MELYRYTPGDSPLLVDIPHAGTHLPAAIAARLSESARRLPDTDWHVDRLYDFAPAAGAGLLVATHSRYVVDLNRPPDGAPLYPRAENTGVCPTRDFDGQALYAPGAEPDAREVAARLAAFWHPYHAKLARELAAIEARFGFALLLDAHSIRSVLPRLFEGRLPDLNLGTNRGRAAEAGLAAAAHAVAESAPGLRAVRDARFTGGYVTRHYGRPAIGRHALQLEIAQAAYMDEARPTAYRSARAAPLRQLLRRFVARLLEWRPTGPAPGAGAAPGTPSG